MTSRMDFDDQLRAWADLGDERLPVQYLNAALAQIDTAPQRRASTWMAEVPPHESICTVCPGGGTIVVAALIGISLLVRPPDVGPTPLPQPSPEASPEPDATPQADAARAPRKPPSAAASSSSTSVTRPRDPCDDRLPGGPFDIFSLDAGTGAQTLLGTTAEDCSANWLSLQWAPDREHILMTDEFGQETLDLDTPAAAGRESDLHLLRSADRRLEGWRLSVRRMAAVSGRRSRRRDWHAAVPGEAVRLGRHRGRQYRRERASEPVRSRGCRTFGAGRPGRPISPHSSWRRAFHATTHLRRDSQPPPRTTTISMSSRSTVPRCESCSTTPTAGSGPRCGHRTARRSRR